jgi:hypothetical protein
VELAALIVAIVTLILAIFIHSETREVFSRVNFIVHTLPGAYDVARCLKDIEQSKQERATVICDAPKNTHINFTPTGLSVSLFRRIKNRFWGIIRKLASYFSGDIFEEYMIQPSVIGRWEIKSHFNGSEDLKESLRIGWEPFSITPDNQVWIRKHINTNE